MKKILIVDTDETILKLLSERLTEKGFDAKASQSAIQSLDLVGPNSFDLALLATDLAETSSYELTSQILEKSLHKTEVFLLSPEECPAIFEGHQAGASQILNKPLNFDTLFEAIEKASAAKESRRHERLDLNEAGLGSLYGQVHLSSSMESLNVEVSNIGRGGFFYQIPLGAKGFQVGEVVNFEVRLSMLPDYEFKGTGIVRWIRSTVTNSGVGIEFLNIPRESETLIQSFVDLFKVRAYVPTGI